jgi:hypothetical protein
LYWAEVSVLLLNKEDLGSIGRVRTLNKLLPESFFKDLVYRLLFFESHGISLAFESFRGVRSEGDNMVPFAMGRKSFSCLFAEYFGVMVVGRGDQFGPVLFFLSFCFSGCKFSGNTGLIDDFWSDTYAED